MKENFEVLNQIIPLLTEEASFKEVENLLMSHSNLPGPRGNLTLAYKFADQFATKNITNDQFNLIVGWININEEEAPTNDPREFLSFCGILAMGTYFAYADEDIKSSIMGHIKTAMNDPRWRIREGVAMGLQRIAEKEAAPVLQYITVWYDTSTDLEKRAFIAALAHPPILDQEEVAQFSLKISENILKYIDASTKESRRTEGFKTLSQGLQYALSVFVAYRPEEGFALLKKYARLNHPEIDKIIKANLGKSRIVKKFPQMVDEVIEIIHHE